MRKYCLLLLLCLATVGTFAKGESMSVRVFIPENDGIPLEANKQLEAKVKQIASNYAIVDDGLNDRFYLSANVQTTSKDIVPTTPPRVSLKMDVILYLGDITEGKLFGSLPLSVMGVGQNENKACIQAFKQIPSKSKELASFFEEMEQEIKEFYTQNREWIIRDVELLVKQGAYEDALSSLLSVPEFCGDIAIEAREMAGRVYQQKIDAEGEALYKKADDLWRVKKDEQAAIDIIGILSGINPTSTASPKGQALAKSMEKFLSSQKAILAEQLRQDREFKMKQYEDDLELRRQQLKDQTSIERAKAEAMVKAAEKVKTIDLKKVTTIIKGWF